MFRWSIMVWRFVLGQDKNPNLETGEMMAQQVRAHTNFAEDQSPVPTSGSSKASVIAAPGDLTSSSGLCEHFYMGSCFSCSTEECTYNSCETWPGLSPYNTQISDDHSKHHIWYVWEQAVSLLSLESNVTTWCLLHELECLHLGHFHVMLDPSGSQIRYP